MKFKITDCAENDIDLIYDNLMKCIFRNVPELRENKHFDINRKIVDENNETIAGCVAGGWWWKAVYADALWVDEKHRGQGLGSLLLNDIEKTALGNNCTLIHLDTFDFQAKDFYIGHGYEVFGILENCPEGHCRYYMKKVIG